jgi:hypothetical protein
MVSAAGARQRDRSGRVFGDGAHRLEWRRQVLTATRSGQIDVQERLMDNVDHFRMFLGRAGNLYGRKDLCPPFHLTEFAQAWVLEGISLSHCIEQISIHLDENSGRYRGGSGDWGLRWLDQIIRKSWYRLTRPPRALPARTDRLYKTNIHEVIADPADEWIFDLVNQTPRTAQHIGPKRIEKAELRGEPGDVPRHPSQMGTSPRPASDRADTAPNPVQPISLKPIDKAEAFLHRELANGEVAAAVIEQYAKDDGIAPRTLDRARSRLRVVSRRTGFGSTGKSWLSLPTTP